MLCHLLTTALAHLDNRLDFLDEIVEHWLVELGAPFERLRSESVKLHHSNSPVSPLVGPPLGTLPSNVFIFHIVETPDSCTAICHSTASETHAMG